MNNTNRHDYMRVADLKAILTELPDDMLVVIPAVDEEDVNHILGFVKILTAGILKCDREECSEVFCMNGATDGFDISDQIRYSRRDISVTELLYGDFTKEDTHD